MPIRESVTLLAASGLLLVAAAVTSDFSLWSDPANETVPWFCGALAIALLIVTLTSALTGCRVGELPRSRVLGVAIGVPLILGIGLVVDAISYGFTDDRVTIIGEWLGFTVILIGLLWLPRLRPRD
ncbi:hypothetical protein HAHE_08800 [Haloferula helveola]|uniref:Uncharacterized protein n=1 Tax=Haloferula helveola TaxID=490095 RepID=A0ABM7RJ05_9BACT|nr:hypothetical protein HAHE_08800 [Haloferula helveola]